MGDVNQFTNLSVLPYNCAKYLMDNSELIWRLLAYSDPNAWKEDSLHPNLTKSQKGALIYDGVREETQCRLFLTTGLDSVWTIESCQLRISLLEVYPTNHMVANIVIGMEVYPHASLSQLSNYRTRADLMIEELIRVFNNAEIGGLGKLFFDHGRHSRCNVITIGNAPFIGKAIKFANWIA